jgi:hypothetical protein
VVDLNSPYHALLGRPTLAKFMAILHYAYLKMKLPGPRGVITITGFYKKSIECTRASSKLAEALVIAEKMRQLLQRVVLTQPGRPASSQPAPCLKPTSGTKEIPPEVDKWAEALVSEVGPSSKLESVPNDLAHEESRCRSHKTFGSPRQKSCIPNKC